MNKLILTTFYVFSVYSASAQMDWKSRGPLYQDKNITVEIEYAMAGNPCGANVLRSQFRYKITKLKNVGQFFINWRFDYFDCGHQLRTRVNSLRINSQTKIGLLIPENNELSALRLANYFNDVRRSEKLPEVSAYEPKSPTSIEPKTITGILTVNKGDTTTLQLDGGYLAGKTVWRWYKGDGKGESIGTGTSIIIRPDQASLYTVRGEGENSTPSVSVNVDVLNNNVAASSINGVEAICEGEKNVRLTVTGGRLVTGDQWVWYQGDCDGSSIGEGTEILVSPQLTTQYYVRAEGAGGTTACRVHEITVLKRSKGADQINGPDKVARGSKYTLRLQGGELAPGARWVWYSGPQANKVVVGEGNVLTVTSVYADQTFYVRAEGACLNSAYQTKTVSVSGSERRAAAPGSRVTSRKNGFFVNGGIIADDPSKLDNLKSFVFTIGGGGNTGWFIRAKISSDHPQVMYEAMDTRIMNYDQTGYYQYNGQTSSKRSAYSGGIYIGGKNLAFYAGAGYGIREKYDGIDQYQYANSFSSGSALVKNTANSFKGIEVEGGLLLKISFFNMMGGISTIQGKYTDYNIGIGFNF